MMSEVLPEPVLVGRERELEELNRELQTAIEGKGRTVFISAEAGIGKTRLVTEFLKSVKQENTIKLTGWCLQHAEIPYFPFIEAFSDYYSTLGERSGEEKLEISAWLKEPAKAGLSDKIQYLSPEAIKDQTFAAVARAIRAMATEKALILLIEDVHWADSASLALLHYLARVINDSERVLVLATFRSEELTSDSAGYPHKLVETLALMRREDLFKQINLPSLSVNCVAEMAESMLEGCLERGLAEKLGVESEGNPLFVVESLRMLKEQNKLIKDKNEWRLATDELGIPSKFKDIMLQRLACLNHAQRKLLDASSVIGEEFKVGLLSAVVEQDSLEVTETLNMIAHSTSLVRPDENRYRFDHARSREILYEALAQQLKREYHSKIAKTLENVKSFDLPLNDLAYHYAQAGNTVKAIQYSLQAGKAALLRFGNVEAIEHFNYILNSIGCDKKWTKERLIACEGLGDAICLFDFAEATNKFEALADSVEDPVLKLRVLRKAMISAFCLGDEHRVFQLAKKAEPYAKADKLGYARILLYRGAAYYLQGEDLASMADYKAALKIFEEEYSLSDIASALLRMGQITPGLGYLEEGLAQCFRSKALSEELSNIRTLMNSLLSLGMAFNMCPLEFEALQSFESLKKINEETKIDDFLVMCFAKLWAARACVQTGNFTEALIYALEGLKLSAKTDSTRAPGFIYSVLARIYAAIGEMKMSEYYFNKLIIMPSEKSAHPWNRLALTKAVFYAGSGRWDLADRYFEQSFDEYKRPKGVNRDIIETKRYFAWALEKQGRYEEAKLQLNDILKAYQAAKERFEALNVQPFLIMRQNVVVGEEFEGRLDLVNISTNQGRLVKIDGFCNPSCRIISLSPFFNADNGSILLKEKPIGPFQTVTINMRLVFSEDGTFKFEPLVFYADNSGIMKCAKADPLIINVKALPSKHKLDEVLLPSQNNFAFNFKSAEKAYNFLLDAFEEDIVRAKLSQQDSGWRTLMEIVRNSQVSKHSMYGRSGRGGAAKQELSNSGLIETRFFIGERGRGGRILKIRVCCENNFVKKALRKGK